MKKGSKLLLLTVSGLLTVFLLWHGNASALPMLGIVTIVALVVFEFGDALVKVRDERNK